MSLLCVIFQKIKHTTKLACGMSSEVKINDANGITIIGIPIPKTSNLAFGFINTAIVIHPNRIHE
jgi:hypothetical protein